ncbi:MAG: response regulator [bacterium]|nr:response regulator [bacterium]
MTQAVTVKKTILVIEDDALTLKAMIDELAHHEYVVLGAEDGTRGLEIALQKKPDLILLDILLPKMDGRDVMQKLREDEWGKNVPVIFLTNMDPDDAMIKEIVKTKPAYYLKKSDWTLVNIAEKIHDVFEEQAKH